MTTQFGGILPAIASPCDEDEVFQEETFAELARHLYEAGVDGLYVCGATGDAFRLCAADRKRAAEIAVACSREASGTVIVHVGAPSTREAAVLAAHAAETGAAGIASMPPVNCGHAQIVSYYTEIAQASGLPTFIYHVPILTGVAPSVAEMLALLDIPGVVGLKLTDWNLFFMRRLMIARPDVLVFNGFDELLAAALLYGACGGIGTWYNLFPRLFRRIYDAARAGNFARAMDLQGRLHAFADVAWTLGIRPAFEHLMRRWGFGPFCFRRPRQPLDADLLTRLEPELDRRIEEIDRVCAEDNG